MIVFCTDLDNTLIYSHRHEIGANKYAVERYQGRPVSYLTEETGRLLQELAGQVCVVPTTTRTTEQYQRVNLGWTPEYALTCNGGVLLCGQVEQKEWYEESVRRIASASAMLKRAAVLLEQEPKRELEVRWVKELFVFTKSRQPQETVARLRHALNPALVDVFANGVKVYVVPKGLSKGEAVRRFRRLVHSEFLMTAGDSAFDISMFAQSDLALAPRSMAERPLPKQTVVMPGNKVFSEELLSYALAAVKERNHESKKRML